MERLNGSSIAPPNPLLFYPPRFSTYVVFVSITAADCRRSSLVVASYNMEHDSRRLPHTPPGLCRYMFCEMVSVPSPLGACRVSSATAQILVEFRVPAVRKHPASSRYMHLTYPCKFFAPPTGCVLLTLGSVSAFFSKWTCRTSSTASSAGVAWGVAGGSSSDGKDPCEVRPRFRPPAVGALGGDGGVLSLERGLLGRLLCVGGGSTPSI